ncbi:MAG: S1 family peptidase [Burkholderiales bacterium]
MAFTSMALGSFARAGVSAALAGALLCGVAQAVGPARVAAKPPDVSAQARSLFERTRDSVPQIRVLLGASETEAATGTGFAVGPGLFLTNYHVVADKALEPDVYGLEFLLPGGRRGPLRILAVDVIHDLAVVQGASGPVRALGLRDTPLAKGDSGYSLGYPLSQGLTVVEGTFNGRSEEQYYERIHFTGAINAGMSGGPALDRAGRVFGINVAVDRRGQLVSFLVPVKFARRLLARAATSPVTAADFGEDVARQLREHQAGLMGTLLASGVKVQRVGEFSLPAKLGEYMQCGANTSRDEDRLFTTDVYFCYTFSSLYIDRRLSTGMISYTNTILRDRGLGALRFAGVEEAQFGAQRFGEAYDRRHHTRWSCQEDIVALHGTQAKTAMCVRRYRRFEGLYDVVLKAATLGAPGTALLTDLTMEGVSFEGAMEFARRYLEAIQWNR